MFSASVWTAQAGHSASRLPIAALAASSGFRGDARFALPDRVADTVLAVADDVPPFDELPADRHAQGWAEGHAAGLAEARREAALRLVAEVASREALQLGMARIDAALEARLREQLRDTVAALCEATLAPLALDEAALLRRVERAAAMLARADDDRLVRLHPDDAAIVAEHIGDTLAIVPDTSLARGAVRVEGASSGIEDGPDQWRAAIAAALDEGEQSGPSHPQQPKPVRPDQPKPVRPELVEGLFFSSERSAPPQEVRSFDKLRTDGRGDSGAGS